MQILPFKPNQYLSITTKASKIFDQYNQLLQVLNTRNLPQPFIDFINENTTLLNTSTLEIGSLAKLVQKKQTIILNKLEKDLKLTPINHHRNLWMALGLIFGLPIGWLLFKKTLIFGMPFGLLIGYVLGTHLDNKSKTENRQLDIEV
jgi:hypothetical protein